MSENLSEKVEKINAQLRAFGREAVQEIKMMKDGQVVGQIRYGYKPQYIFDAVNSVLLPENWRYEVVSKDIYNNQMVAETKLFVRINEDEWLCKGSQTGHMQIIKNNVGDAYKGSITAALMKCFSVLSVGSDAYKGLLRDVYFNNRRPQEKIPFAQPQQQNQRTKPEQNPEQNQETVAELPKIAGIEYQRKGGRVVATGNSFDKKELLKSAGFKWDGSGKHWYREMPGAQC